MLNVRMSHKTKILSLNDYTKQGVFYAKKPYHSNLLDASVMKNYKEHFGQSIPQKK